MEYVKSFDSTVDVTLKNIRQPGVLKAIVHMLLILYAARIAPVPSREISQLFQNQYFQLLVFALILWTAQVSPSTSILISIAFLMTINHLSNKKMWEFLENVEGTTAPETTTSESTTQVPTPEMAVETASTIVTSQINSSEVVQGVQQQSETIVVQPTITQNEAGERVVIQPTVLIAPAVVETPSGEQVVVTPDVATLSVAPPAPTAMPSAMPQAMPTEVPKVEQVAVAVEVPKVEQQVEVPKQEPEPAPAPAPAPTAQKTLVMQPAACYPMRSYDMSKVSAIEGDNYGAWTK